MEKKVFTTYSDLSLDSAFLELHQRSGLSFGPMNSPKVQNCSRESNSVPYECKADAVPTTLDIGARY